jgi:hypothetical protein
VVGDPLKRTSGGSRLVWAGFSVWLALALVGGAWATRHSAIAGQSAAAPETWPTESRLERAPGKPTLIVLVHPRCTCSQATVSELARLLARVPGRASAIVVFVKPPGVTGDRAAWDNGDLRRAAERIAGVRVVVDEQGEEALRFHASTSGQTLLYSTDGALQFNGGLTPSRGHEGDSDGKAALEAKLGFAGASPSGAETTLRSRVFGCGLFKKEGSS